jgi:LGFP repeat
MRAIANRHAAVIGLAAVALIGAGCSNGGKTVDASAPPQVGVNSSTTSTTPAPPTGVKLIGESGVEVTLTGPIAAKYSSATQSQRDALGKPLTGDRNAGTRDSGVVFQQFQGGAITAKNGEAGTPAYIITGKIREAWNIPRGPDGAPAVTGNNGSAGPLGLPTSDVKTVGDLFVSTFEHGKIEYNPTTGQVDVTVNGKVVPSGL